jgi:glycosyltransferase involved in cell wall biosynthesis
MTSSLIVTVVLATYNGAPYIAAQLDSLARQTRRPDRLVLRDDGSSDDTVQQVREWARVRQIELQEVLATERLGPARSFLTALKAAKSADVYFFCDQDDVWMPHKIERALDALKRIDPAQPHLIATRLNIVDNTLQFLRLSPQLHDLSFASAVCESVLTGCTMSFNASLRKLLVRELPQRLEMHDWWCYLLASGTGGVSFDVEPSVMYRQHSQNSIGAGPQGVARVLARIARLFGDDVKVRSRQLQEFSRLHAQDLRPDAADLLKQLVVANWTLAGRWNAALNLPIKRQNLFDQLTTRISLLVNRF